MDILKRLKRSRGFTLIEIAIVVAIIGILILVALPLFSGARNRAYLAEARQMSSEWKSLVWACLVEKGFAETRCDAGTEISWDPSSSSAWNWDTAQVAFNCGAVATVTVAAAGGTCTADQSNTDPNSYIALDVPAVSGPTSSYVLLLRTMSGKAQESPADGTDVPSP